MRIRYGKKVQVKNLEDKRTDHSGDTAATISGGMIFVATIPGQMALIVILSFILRIGAVLRTKFTTAALAPLYLLRTMVRSLL